MSFLIGFAFIFFLAIFTILLWLIARRVPKEAALVSIAFLCTGDAILVGLWYFSLVDLVPDVRLFRVGIAGAFATASMGRSIYFLLKQNAEM